MWQLYLSHSSFLLRNVLVCNWAQGMLDRNNSGRYKSLGWSRERDKNSFSSIPHLILSAFFVPLWKGIVYHEVWLEGRDVRKGKDKLWQTCRKYLLIQQRDKTLSATQDPRAKRVMSFCPFLLLFIYGRFKCLPAVFPNSSIEYWYLIIS